MIERRFSLALLAVVLLSLLCSASAQGAWQLGLMLAAAAIAGWMITRRAERGLPRWLMGILLAGLVLYSTLEVLEPGGSSVTPFTTFLASVATLKLWERRRVRDDAQLLGISVFLNIGAILACAERRQADFTMGVLLFAVVPALVYATVLLQVRAATERARLAGREPLPPSDAVVRRSMRTLGRLTLALVLAGFLIGTLSFVLVPRPEGPRGWRTLGPSITVTAFRDHIDLGNAGLLSQSQAIALKVTPATDARLAGLLGPRQELYLRGAVLDTYAAGSWRSSIDARAWEEDPVLERWIHVSPSSDAPLTLKVRDLSAYGGTRPLFSPWRPQRVRLQNDPSKPFVPRLLLDPETHAMLVERPEGELAYSVEVARESLDASGEPSPARPPVAFPFPESIRRDARDRLIAAGIEPDPAKRPWEADARAVRVLEQSLREQCAYSTEIRAAPPDLDPTEWFLLRERRGHCEYFASALAAMCRGVGIDARVIAGYVSSELDEETRTFTVRQAGAHAWVEAMVAPARWRSFDATPADEMSRLLGEKKDLFGVLDRWLVGLESAWLSGMVRFDDELRRSLIDPGSRPRTREWGRSRSPVERVRRAARDHGATLLFGALALAGILGVFWLSRRRAPGPGPRRGELGRLHGATLRALRRSGGPKPAWQGSLDYLDALAPRSPALALHARPIVELCYRAWFDGSEPSRAEVRDAWKSLARVKSDSRARVR